MLLFVKRELWSIIDDSGSVVSSVVPSHLALLSFHMLARNLDRAQVMHRGWAYFQARLAFTMAAFNVLVQWHGLRPYASGFVPLSIAEFSL
jgi:hypothetical protein